MKQHTPLLFSRAARALFLRARTSVLPALLAAITAVIPHCCQSCGGARKSGPSRVTSSWTKNKRREKRMMPAHKQTQETQAHIRTYGPDSKDQDPPPQATT